MSRDLLLGTITYPWPNDGDTDWGQLVFDWARAVTTQINDIEESVSVGGSEYKAGVGLFLNLNTNTFSIPEEAITFHLLNNTARESIFGAPLDNRSFVGFLQKTDILDFYPRDLLNSNDTVAVARGDSRRGYFINTDTGLIRQSGFSKFTTATTLSITTFGTASNGNYVYLPLLDGTSITHLHAFGNNYFYRPQGDITLSESVPGAEGEATSLVYNFSQSAFYFINNVKDIYKIENDGTVSVLLRGEDHDDIPANQVMTSAGTYLCFYDRDYGRGELTVTALNLANTEGPTFPIRTFTLGAPLGVTGNTYKHYGFTIINGILYTFTDEGPFDHIKLMEYNGFGGIFGSTTSVSDSGEIADDSVGPDKLITTNTATDGQILSKGAANTFTWVAASEAGVEDLSGVRGGSGITVTHTNSNEIATVAVTDSIQGALVPTGGSTNQVLAKQSGNDHDLYWRNDADTPYTAGQGLTLSDSREFSIPNDELTYGLMSKQIRNYLFQAPLPHSSADIAIEDLDEAQLISISENLIGIIPRAEGADGNNVTYVGLDGRETVTVTLADSDSSSQFGVAFDKNRDRLYRPTISSNTVTHLRAYSSNGSRHTGDDITLDTAIPNTDTIRTSVTYSEFADAFYFLSANKIYKIELDGTRTELFTKSFVDGTIIEAMNNYLCEYNINYDGGAQSYILHQLSNNGLF